MQTSRWTAVLIAAGLTLSVAACGGDDAESDSDTTTPGTAVEQATTDTDASGDPDEADEQAGPTTSITPDGVIVGENRIGEPTPAPPDEMPEQERQLIESFEACVGGSCEGDRNFNFLTLPGAQAAGADLSGAQLSGSDLSGADLSGADLSNADLSGAILVGANLSGANITGANLGGAILLDANVTGTDLDSAKYCRTTMPDGSLRDGQCLELGIADPSFDDPAP